MDDRARPASGSATLPHRGTAHRRVGFEGGCDRWRERLRAPGRPLDEAEGLALLGDWGVPVVAAEVADSLEGAVAAAGRLGWPVALKTAAPGVAHKSDVGGVRLGLEGPDRLAAAYADLAARLGPRVLVAAMAPPGVELALGVVTDPQFGPLVMVAAGGVLVELLGDRRFALPPVDHRQAIAMLDRLAVRPLLDGVRGSPRPTWTRSPTRSSTSPPWPSTSATGSPRSTSTRWSPARRLPGVDALVVPRQEEPAG